MAAGGSWRATEPSLPHRAGKAFERVYAAFRVAYEASGGDETRFRQAVARLAPQPRLLIESKSSAGSRSIQALAIARPEPDLQLLAKALLMQAPDKRKGGGDASDVSGPSEIAY